jgi:hypothetical protein
MKKLMYPFIFCMAPLLAMQQQSNEAELKKQSEIILKESTQKVYLTQILPTDLKKYILPFFAQANSAQEALNDFKKLLTITPELAENKDAIQYIIDLINEEYTAQLTAEDMYFQLDFPGTYSWKVTNAAANDNCPVLLQLFKAGANPNERAPKYQNTPLIIASKWGNLYAVQTLLAAGANPNIQGIHKDSALGEAIKFGGERKPLAWHFNRYLPVISALLKAGANANIKVGTSYPLFYVINRRNLDLLKLLLDAGIRLDVTSSFGSSPVEFAEKNGTPEIVALLKKYSAK